MLTEKTLTFLSRNPTVLGKVGPVTYYEHPVYGNEYPMFYIEDGKLCQSVFWDIDSAQDAQFNQF